MPRDAGVYLQDILEAVGRIETYVRGLDRAAFEADEKTVGAVLRNLEIVGEATKRVPGSSGSSLRRRSGGRSRG